MYIYERNKVGHRYFQRLLSSQGGSVFRHVRRGRCSPRPRSPAAERAGTGEVAGILRPPAGGLPLPPGRCLPAGQETVSLSGSGDGVALPGAGASSARCTALFRRSVPPRVPCSPALGWGGVFPERETGDGKSVLEHVDLHQSLPCLSMSNAVCTFDVLSGVIKLTPKLACSAGNARRDVEERPVCFLAGSHVSFVGLVRWVAHIRTSGRKAYGR